MIFEEKKHFKQVCLRVSIVGVFVIITLFSPVNENYEGANVDKDVYLQFLTSIGTIIATILTIAFSFFVIGAQYFFPNYSPKYDRHIFANFDIILSFILLSLMVIVTFFLLNYYPNFTSVILPMLYLIFSLGLLYYDFYCISNLLKVDSIMDDIRKKTVEKIMRCNDSPLEADELYLRDISDNMDFLLQHLVKDSEALRIESLEYGIVTLSSILAKSYELRYIGFCTTSQLLDSFLPLAITKKYNRLIRKILYLLWDMTDRLNKDNFDEKEVREGLMMTNRYSSLMTTLLENEDKDNVLQILYILEKISLNIKPLSAYTNNIFKDFSGKIDVRNLTILYALIQIQSEILFKKVKNFSFIGRIEFIESVINPANSLSSSIKRLLEFELEESLFASITNELISGKNSFITTSFILVSKSKQTIIAGQSEPLEIDLLIQSFLKVLQDTFESIVMYSINHEMKYFIINTISKGLVDLLLISLYSNNEKRLLEVFKLFMIVSFFMIEKGKKDSLDYNQYFLDQIKNYFLTLLPRS